VAALSCILVLGACGSASQASPTPAAASATGAGGEAPSEGPTGPAELTAPREVEAGVVFEVEWTGPDQQGDYITIVAAGATAWTNEPYFYTTVGSPSSLTAPVAPGAYALWYVSGADESILTRLAISVLPFEGDLLAADEVQAGAEFEVAWNGPNGPGDYVTIVPEGADQWTDESYFYTTVGSPGTLVAPVEEGDYELWYVPGAETEPSATRPITVTPYVVTLEAPARVDRGSQFEVEWVGPNGPSDYVTIVPAGSPEGTYLSYFYTASGSPGTLTAPDEPGNYEIWYASDRVEGTFASIDIIVE
jgi:Ca-activated chloride channel family protein